MTDTPQASQKLHLYVRPFDSGFASSHPPIQVQLLRGRNLEAAATLMCIALSLEMTPPFCWDDGSAWLDCHDTGFPEFRSPIFDGVEDFINALPDLQAWLDAWADSKDRAPDPAPKWAVQRQVDGKLVVSFGRRVEHQLSAPKTCTIRFCNSGGQDLCLAIPSRASLSLPPPASELSRTVHVVGKEDMVSCCMPTGAEVLLSARALGESTAPIVVDPRYLRLMSVTSAGIQSVPDLPSGGALA